MNRQRFIYLAGLGLLLVGSLTPINGKPLLLTWFDAGATVAQNVLQRPQVNLQLSAAKQQIQTDAQGQPKVTWQPLPEQSATVQPGEVLRYSLLSSNRGNRPAARLVVNQPIPAGMVYVLGSTQVGNRQTVAVTYSIDRGKTFVAEPTIQVTLPNGKIETRPAPAEAYTHIRLSFTEPLPPSTTVKATYDVRVR